MSGKGSKTCVERRRGPGMLLAPPYPFDIGPNTKLLGISSGILEINTSVLDGCLNKKVIRSYFLSKYVTV